MSAAGGGRRSRVRFLDAWEDGRWIWRDRPQADPQVELVLVLLRRATVGLVLLVAACSVVAGQLEGSGRDLWNGALQGFLFLAVPIGTGLVATEWLLRAQAGAEAEDEDDHA